MVGSADSVYSRILSLRRMAWNQGDDSLLQMIGFKTDIYMNTVYQSGLMSKLIIHSYIATSFIYFILIFIIDQIRVQKC